MGRMNDSQNEIAGVYAHGAGMALALRDVNAAWSSVTPCRAVVAFPLCRQCYALAGYGGILAPGLPACSTACIRAFDSWARCAMVAV